MQLKFLALHKIFWAMQLHTYQLCVFVQQPLNNCRRRQNYTRKALKPSTTHPSLRSTSVGCSWSLNTIFIDVRWHRWI